MIPSKTVWKSVRSGYKVLKDRISVMLCTNMTGTHKLKPLVIGKANNPHCFRNFKPQTLVNYEASKKTWMTSGIFTKWLLEMDLTMVKLKKKILLVVDNCASHKVDLKLKNIELLFLPSNSTASLQPLDQGVIRSFKSYFNTRKLREILVDVEKGNSVWESFKKINVKNSIIHTKLVWDDVTLKTIVKCFEHAGWCENKNASHQEVKEIDGFDEFIQNCSN